MDLESAYKKGVITEENYENAKEPNIRKEVGLFNLKHVKTSRGLPVCYEKGMLEQ